MQSISIFEIPNTAPCKYTINTNLYHMNIDTSTCTQCRDFSPSLLDFMSMRMRMHINSVLISWIHTINCNKLMI